ncbi:hypothetical protein [Trichothermofontia sp.]
MNWQPHQIVYLQAEHARLFAEIIQVIPDRQVLWLRPLALEKSRPHPDSPPLAAVTLATVETQARSDESEIHDLRQGSDLLWPMTRVQPALDLEVIPLLARLGSESPKLEPPIYLAHQHLYNFIQQLYQQQLNQEA